MRRLTFVLDPTRGSLTLEGPAADEAAALLADLLPAPRAVNCARPLEAPPAPHAGNRPGEGEAVLRVARLYHGSVVDGPGRRSVVQLQGCVRRCPGCYAPETHDLAGGSEISVRRLVAMLLGPDGEPRDGFTVTGGEPFLQPAGLLALLQTLKEYGEHTVVYTGATLEELAGSPEPAVRAALALVDLLIDGPYLRRLGSDAGEWRGSRNQRLLANPLSLLTRSAPPSPDRTE